MPGPNPASLVRGGAGISSGDCPNPADGEVLVSSRHGRAGGATRDERCRLDSALAEGGTGEGQGERRTDSVPRWTLVASATTRPGVATGKAGFCLYDTKKTARASCSTPGISDAEAMDFSGHRTASMLHHYRK